MPMLMPPTLADLERVEQSVFPETDGPKRIEHVQEGASWPPAAGVKIGRMSQMFGHVFWDPELRTKLTVYATHRPYLPNCVEVLIAYYADRPPEIRTFDWGVELHKNELPDVSPWTTCPPEMMRRFIINIDTPSGVLPAFATVSGISPSQRRHMVLLYAPAEKKWIQVHLSQFARPEEGTPSMGYSQLEIFTNASSPEPPPRLGRGLGGMGLRFYYGGQFIPPDAQSCSVFVDPYVLNGGYRRLFEADVFESWGYAGGR